MAAVDCNQKSDEIVIQQLKELFGSNLTQEVIQQVARACSFNVQESSNQLLELSNGSINSFLKIELKTTQKSQSDLVARNNSASKTTQKSQYDLVARNNSASTMPPNPPRRKSKKSIEIDNAIGYINKGYKVMVLLRGLPGSGKSSLAKNILENTIGLSNETMSNHVLSTDDYFMKNGMYQYDSSKIGDAHGWNHNRAFKAMSKGYSPVIIDNTNTEMWEMKPYAIMATDYGYFLEILEPDTHWCFNENELAKRNTHGVSKQHIKVMIDRFDKNISPAKLLSAYDCRYVLQKPPQFRLFPPLNQRVSQANITKSQSTNTVCETVSKSNSNTPKKPLQLNIKPLSTSPNKVELTNGEKHSALRLNPFAALAQNSFPSYNLVKSQSFTANGLNHKTFDHFKSSNSHLTDGDIIDLMDFDDQHSNNSSSTNASANQQNKTKTDAVDSLLMHSSGSPIRSNVLWPVQTFENKKSETKPRFGDISAWGVDEKALRSWDIVTPIDTEDKDKEQPFILIEDDVKLVDTNECGVTTDEDDFYILRNVNSPELRNVRDLELTTVKVLDCLSRDINRNTVVKNKSVTKRLMLDKGCMTDEVLDEELSINQLMTVFPDIPKTHLVYWFKKCKGDLDWTIEFLLAEKDEALNIDLTEDDEIDKINQIVISQTLDSDSDRNSPVDNQPFKTVKTCNNKKKRKSPPTTEESISLKKSIEQKFDISSDHYSEHLLKVKHQKFGSNSGDNDNQRPGTSSQGVVRSNVKTRNRFEGLDDMDLDNGADSNSDNEENDDTIELNLGDQFVEQLEGHFGDRMPKYPKGYMPIVQIPVALAQQLFAFYIESVFSQMEAQKSILDDMAKEDEEFAKKLQAEEEKANMPRPVPNDEPENFREIMKEQVELSKWQKEADKWKLMTPDSLAARLTRQKLFAAFPSLHQDTLIEILHAHDNIYKDTVETLLASCGSGNYVGEADTIKEPALDDTVLKEMKDAHTKYRDQEFKEEKQTAQQYREEAQRYYKRRKELYDKANVYNQNGMTEVAMFYSGLARQQTVYFEMANGRAAQAFLNEHDKRLQDFNTLDFHFLYVKEAIPTLDVFLDRTINLLRSTGQHADMLHVITGRGKNSEGGVSKIKPAVEARLRKRKIIYQHLNPGLLKIKVTSRHLLTDEMEYTNRHS